MAKIRAEQLETIVVQSGTPSTSDDAYAQGTVWVSTSTNKPYMCLDNSAANALWHCMVSTSGTPPQDVTIINNVDIDITAIGHATINADIDIRLFSPTLIINVPITVVSGTVTVSEDLHVERDLFVGRNTSMSGTLDMNSNKILNVANGTQSGDAVNYGQLSAITDASGHIADDSIHVKMMTSGTTPPTSSNDSTDGYSPGSLWIDTVTDKVYVCIDSSTGVALWIQQNNVFWNTVDPTVDDDETIGMQLGTKWLNTSTREEFRCWDGTNGAAVWTRGGTGNVDGPVAQSSTNNAVATWSGTGGRDIKVSPVTISDDGEIYALTTSGTTLITNDNASTLGFPVSVPFAAFGIPETGVMLLGNWNGAVETSISAMPSGLGPSTPAISMVCGDNNDAQSFENRVSANADGIDISSVIPSDFNSTHGMHVGPTGTNIYTHQNVNGVINVTLGSVGMNGYERGDGLTIAANGADLGFPVPSGTQTVLLTKDASGLLIAGDLDGNPSSVMQIFPAAFGGPYVQLVTDNSNGADDKNAVVIAAASGGTYASSMAVKDYSASPTKDTSIEVYSGNTTSVYKEDGSEVSSVVMKGHQFYARQLAASGTQGLQLMNGNFNADNALSLIYHSDYVNDPSSDLNASLIGALEDGSVIDFYINGGGTLSMGLDPNSGSLPRHGLTIDTVGKFVDLDKWSAGGGGGGGGWQGVIVASGTTPVAPGVTGTSDYHLVLVTVDPGGTVGGPYYSSYIFLNLATIDTAAEAAATYFGGNPLFQVDYFSADAAHHTGGQEGAVLTNNGAGASYSYSSTAPAGAINGGVTVNGTPALTYSASTYLAGYFWCSYNGNNYTQAVTQSVAADSCLYYTALNQGGGGGGGDVVLLASRSAGTTALGTYEEGAVRIGIGRFDTDLEHGLHLVSGGGSYDSGISSGLAVGSTGIDDAFTGLITPSGSRMYMGAMDGNSKLIKIAHDLGSEADGGGRSVIWPDHGLSLDKTAAAYGITSLTAPYDGEMYLSVGSDSAGINDGSHATISIHGQGRVTPGTHTVTTSIFEAKTLGQGGPPYNWLTSETLESGTWYWSHYRNDPGTSRSSYINFHNEEGFEWELGRVDAQTNIFASKMYMIDDGAFGPEFNVLIDQTGGVSPEVVLHMDNTGVKISGHPLYTDVSESNTTGVAVNRVRTSLMAQSWFITTSGTAATIDLKENVGVHMPYYVATMPVSGTNSIYHGLTLPSSFQNKPLDFTVFGKTASTVSGTMTLSLKLRSVTEGGIYEGTEDQTVSISWTSPYAASAHSGVGSNVTLSGTNANAEVNLMLELSTPADWGGIDQDFEFLSLVIEERGE